MEQIKGYSLSDFPFDDLEKVKDLLYYDGPLLSHFTDLTEEDHYFFLWVDYDDNFNRWLVFKVDAGDLVEYLEDVQPLYDLIWKNTNEFLFLVDIDVNVNYHNTKMVRHYDIPESYIPDENSYFNSTTPAEYKSFIDSYKANNLSNAEIRYIDALRENAMFLKITPNSKKHGTIVNAFDASDFLKEISNSYIGYAEVQFMKAFSQDFSTYEKLKSAQKQVVSQIKPQLVQVGISSFAVGIASDFMNDSNNKNIYSWKKSLAQNFKEEIIDIDFTSIEELEKVKAKYSDDERQAIFKPLLKVLKNKSYSVSVTDIRFKERKKLKVLSQKTEGILLKRDISSEKEKQDAAFELVSIIVEKPVNEAAEKLSKKSLQEGFLFSQPTTGFEYVLNSVSYKEDGYQFKKPLHVKVTYENKVYTVALSELDIHVSTSQKEELLHLINKELVEKLNYLTSIKSPQDKENSQWIFISDYLLF